MNPYILSATGPHIKAKTTTANAMRDVLVALIPITLVSVYFFRAYAIFLISVCLTTAVLTELLFRHYMKKKPTLRDGSALVTGLLVAMCFSATTSWWRGALATFIAVGIAKELMGGLGWNRFNPALFGRVAIILLAPWFVAINASLSPWSLNLGPVDVMTHATPLAMLQQGMSLPSYTTLFLGFPGGAMSEASVLAVLIGAAYLIYRKLINWRIPAAMLSTVFVFTLLLGKDPVYHLLTGGLMLGSFFMATDWVTSPINNRGKVAFGVLIGLSIVVFRVILAPTEGVAFSILIMNAFVPTIERLTRSRTFGHVKATSPLSRMVRTRESTAS
jgi:electron transport complex protein RnfD